MLAAWWRVHCGAGDRQAGLRGLRGHLPSARAAWLGSQLQSSTARCTPIYLPAAASRPPAADGTETASLFATLGTDVLPDEEQPEAEVAEGDGEERHASDRDDYSSGPEASPQQVHQGQRRPSSRSSSRSRRSGSADRGGGADLPASAGVRSEAVAQQEEGGDAANGSGKGDAKILRELFEGSDVRGAIDHTKVEGEEWGCGGKRGCQAECVCVQ